MPFLIQKSKWILRKEFDIKCLFLWLPQFLEYEKISDSRNFSGSTSGQSKCSSRDLSFTWATCSSSRALYHTFLVHKLFEAARNDSKFSSGPHCNLFRKEGQTYGSLYQFLLAADDLVVAALWLLSSNPGVSAVECCCFNVFVGEVFNVVVSSFFYCFITTGIVTWKVYDKCFAGRLTSSEKQFSVKSLSKNFVDINYPDSVCDHRRVIKLSWLADSLANRQKYIKHLG